MGSLWVENEPGIIMISGPFINHRQGAIVASRRRTSRRLPPGVTPGLWEYVRSYDIAEDFDEHFVFNRLFEFDEQVLSRYFVRRGAAAPLVVDLGCGTGRTLVPLVKKGLRGVGVDLSRPMLEVAREKAELAGVSIDLVETNLVELDALGNASADYCMCMFSTLGMVAGRENRASMLQHARRILKPGGLFILHAHNYWQNVREPGGLGWMAHNWWHAAWRSDVAVGDKVFPYRGVENMYLHLFRRGELLGELRGAGFRTQEVIALDAPRRGPLRWRWLFGSFRANGWIVVCQ